MNSDARAIAIGAVVFAVGSVATLVIPLPFDWLLFAPAVLSGAVAAFFVHSKRIYPFVLLGCTNAMLVGLLSLSLTPFGMTDFPG